MALEGNEIIYVQGVSDLGSPAATQFPTTTGAIAALAESFDSTDQALTALNTVGAGTLTASLIVGGGILRGGTQSGSAFTDTSATAALIIAALPTWAQVGQSFELVYVNNTDAVATIAGGTGVTVSGITTVQPNMVARYLVTYASSTTVTMAGLGTAMYNPANALGLGSAGLVVKGSSSGATTVVATAAAGTTTHTLPAVTGVAASTSGSNLYIADLKRCSASVTANATTTYANVTGLSFTVVPGTYEFVLRLPSTVASGTGGIKYAFNYTTTVLSAIEATGRGYTASAVAVQHTTPTTTQTDLFTQAAVVIFTEITGTMVVTTGGTVDVQMAQNTSNASNTVALIGASAQFTRIA